jgi:ABC-type multidrug transport system permease subunit
VNVPPGLQLYFLRVFNMQFEKSVFSNLRRVVDRLFKSNLTFCVVCVFNLQFEKSVFFIQRQIKKKHLYMNYNMHNTFSFLSESLS